MDGIQHPGIGGASPFLAIWFQGRQLAANVNLHGASPWHPRKVLLIFPVATIMRLHRTNRWYLLRVFTQRDNTLVRLITGGEFPIAVLEVCKSAVPFTGQTCVCIRP